MSDAETTLAVAAVVEEIRDQRRESAEIEVSEVAERLELSRDVDATAEEIEEIMLGIADAGRLEVIGPDRFHGPGFRLGSEPSECDWCPRPFPEAGRYTVDVYDPDGEFIETVEICSECFDDY